MRSGCFLWIITFALLWGGGQSLYTGLLNREITEITIGALLKEPPSKSWLRVTGGELDIFGLAYEESLSGDTKELYIPVHPPGADTETAKVHLIYQTKDSSYIGMFNSLERMGKLDPVKDIDRITRMMKKLRVLSTQNIEGLAQFGIESDSGDEKAKKLFSNLASDCLILEAGEEPSLVFGLVMTIAGLLVGGFLLKGVFGKSEDEAAQ